jgi:hypothetical protein
VSKAVQRISCQVQYQFIVENTTFSFGLLDFLFRRGTKAIIFDRMFGSPLIHFIPDCCFRAKYGKIRGGDAIMVKEAFTKPCHTTQPAPSTAKSRAHKQRLKRVIESGVNHVIMAKDQNPVPKDVGHESVG